MSSSISQFPESSLKGRVKKNVHVTLAFSPVGDSFRNRLRSFPSLVNCCTIDWHPASHLVVTEPLLRQLFTCSPCRILGIRWTYEAFAWHIVPFTARERPVELEIQAPWRALRFHEWPAEALYSVAKQQITGQSVELPNLEGALKMCLGGLRSPFGARFTAVLKLFLIFLTCSQTFSGFRWPRDLRFEVPDHPPERGSQQQAVPASHGTLCLCPWA